MRRKFNPSLRWLLYNHQPRPVVKYIIAGILWIGIIGFAVKWILE